MVGRTGEQNVPRLEVCILARIFPNFDVRNVCLLSSTGCISFVEYRGYDSFPNGIAVRHPRRSEVMSSECQGYNRQQRPEIILKKHAPAPSNPLSLSIP